MKKYVLHTAIAGLCFAGAANAAEILVTSDIATSTTWTANNTYNLQTQIYVLPGATLTIEAGTIIASDTGIGGSLAVTRGAQIIANGTAANPIIFTSKADVATWVGGDPKTGTARLGVNEWGNLTICGNAYVSENATPGNTAAPSAANYAIMEGLTEAFPGDTRVRYGGGNDDDDSGSLRYVSFRYGGRVIGLNNELNGLSLGGIGRGTDISHVEIFNNVDDGIEIWGGTVNLKYFSIWNIGDDSLDVDQGWRGKAQFGLIVQGFSAAAPQGSGVGDNAIEIDGAEQSDYQPVTTTALYNMTVIGQPISGDHGTAWRDNARAQIRNSIFMDLGERLVAFDNIDGDGGNGYGFNGTLSWADTWTTNWNAAPAHANDPAPGLGGWLGYPAQTNGKLAEITDSVFYNNLNGAAYTEATARGVLPGNATNNNVNAGTFAANPANQPIRSITRGPATPAGALTMLPVIQLDPRPAAAALTSVNAAPNDGFFTPAQYRGAFAPGDVQHWLCDWTATFAYGLTPAADLGTQYCFGDGSGVACPCGNSSAVGDNVGCLSSLNVGGKLRATGCSSLSNDTVVLIGTQMPNSSALYFQGTTQAGGGNGVAFGDGKRCAAGAIIRLGTKANAAGASSYPVGADLAVSVRGLVAVPGTRTYQVWYRNAAAFCTADTFNLTNGLQLTWEL
ncbi:MAG: hypothetical protein JNK02_00595 [Planctomycetes bacterium]|nr:hypothetical protein [Planctomycetota bacterium]